jgi:hypothetical protein
MSGPGREHLEGFVLSPLSRFSPGFAALATPFLALERARATLEWWSRLGSGYVRLSAIPVLILGGVVALHAAVAATVTPWAARFETHTGREPTPRPGLPSVSAQNRYSSWIWAMGQY